MLKKSLSFTLLFLFTIAVSAKRPKNVIFMIGDGMGMSHIYAAMVANGNSLELERAPYMGYSKTYSADNFTTDSGAGGTALASGVKTKNGMIGMNPDSVAVESIMYQSARNGKSTGLVVASSVTDPTPATYVAHQVSRYMDEAIALDYLQADLDVFIGGGRKFFDPSKREDGLNLIDSLDKRDFQIAYTMDELRKIKAGKVAGLLFEQHPDPMPNRGNFLEEASLKAIDLLKKNKQGFFLMIEGSQIDWGAHDNDFEKVKNEMLDFDATIGKVLNFAKKDKQTLVIITSDHETGGLTIPKGDMLDRTMKPKFSTGNHTGVPVPVFAFGPGADQFIGFMENTAFKGKIEKLLKLKKLKK